MHEGAERARAVSYTHLFTFENAGLEPENQIMVNISLHPNFDEEKETSGTAEVYNIPCLTLPAGKGRPIG